MKKIILTVFLLGLIVGGLYIAYHIYNHFEEKKRKDSYYENLVDTSSPTVKVLRDSLLIPYQNEKRTIHIYVPPNYEKDSLERFPVIYLMDGESAFNDLENMAPEWQVDEVINTSLQQGIQPSIVIAINEGKDRDAEYTPFVNADTPNAHGAEFSEWLATDLKKWVDTNYRTMTQPEATTIGGISRSGMMAYYILMAHPHIFGNTIIQSPSMWVDYDRLMALDLDQEQLDGKKIFVSVGGKEGYPMIPDARSIFKKFQNKGLNKDKLRFEIIPNEGHWHITWRKSFAKAYPWLMKKPL